MSRHLWWSQRPVEVLVLVPVLCESSVLPFIHYTTFICFLNEQDGYIHLDEIEWTEERWQHGVEVKLQKVPFTVKLFKIVAPNGDIDWVITNHSAASLTAADVQNADAHRWHIEPFHRELKQLTGIENCQCRKQRSQPNHIACCYQAGLALKVKATQLVKPVYALNHD
jgi:hypothetical protein